MPARTPSWWTALAAVVAVLVSVVCGVILWSFIPPVVYFPIFAFASAVLVILGALWLAFALLGWFKFKAWKWTAVAPVLVLATATLVVFSVPSRTAFAVSENALTEAAANCRLSYEKRYVGVYRVRRTQPTDAGCLFHIEGGLLDSIGLAYLPGGAPYIGDPQFEGDVGYRTFDGDWYSFVQRF